MPILIDCGNTSCKWAQWADGHLGAVQRVEPQSVPLRDAPLVLLPGNEQSAELVRAQWMFPISTVGGNLAVPALGQYATCGHDRVCAGMAAVAAYGACVVVDAGTATTVTAWNSIAGQAAFAGGLIIPGMQACAHGLQLAAPALPALTIAEQAGSSSLQHSTPGAMATALTLGYPGMVERCVAAVVRESGLNTVVLTGGNHAGLLSIATQVDEHLVLQGIGMLYDQQVAGAQ